MPTEPSGNAAAASGTDRFRSVRRRCRFPKAAAPSAASARSSPRIRSPARAPCRVPIADVARALAASVRSFRSSYDSGAGNGAFGFGWSLSLPAITRKTDKGLPRYRDAEIRRLHPLRRGRPGARASGNVAMGAIRWPRARRVRGLTIASAATGRASKGCSRASSAGPTRAAGDVHWRSISRDNVTHALRQGRRIAASSIPPIRPRIFSWLICESHDDKGNAIVYDYKAEDGAGVDLTQAHERNRGAATTPRARPTAT